MLLLFLSSVRGEMLFSLRRREMLLLFLSSVRGEMLFSLRRREMLLFLKKKNLVLSYIKRVAQCSDLSTPLSSLREWTE
jgi:hypothetical protein